MSRDFAAVASKEARRENDEVELRGGQGTTPRNSKGSARRRPKAAVSWRDRKN